MKILITGAAGAVGTVLIKGLGDRYQLRAFDRLPLPELEDVVVGELTDFEAVVRATQGMDAVIHLAGNPSGAAPWEEILHSNIIGTYNLFEAARRERGKPHRFRQSRRSAGPLSRGDHAHGRSAAAPGELLFDQQSIR